MFTRVARAVHKIGSWAHGGQPAGRPAILKVFLTALLAAATPLAAQQVLPPIKTQSLTSPSVNLTYYTDQYTGGLPALIAALGSTPATVVCPADGSMTLAATLTIPSNITYDAQQGCITTLGNFNLYDNGPVTSGPWQIYNQNGTGRIYFGYNGSAAVATLQSFDYPEWWGAKPDGTTNSLPAMESAIRAWPIVSTITGYGHVRLQVSPGGTSLLGYYLQGGNLLVDHGVDLGGYALPGIVGDNGNSTQGAWLIFDPGYGLLTSSTGMPTATGSDGGIAVNVHLHDFGVTVKGYGISESAVSQGSDQIVLAGTSTTWGVNDLAVVAAPGQPFPAGTYVTTVNGSTLTLSQNAAIPMGSGEVFVFRIPAALRQTATASTGSCTYTSVSNVDALVPGEEIEGYIGSTQIPLYAYIAGINYASATIDVWGGGNYYSNENCNAPASGTATFWPVPPGIGLYSEGGIDRVTAQYVAGNGIDIHGNSSEGYLADYDWMHDSQAIYVGGNGLDIQGNDANSVMVSGTGAGSFGYLGLNGVHNTGLSNHFYALGFEDSGLSDILEANTSNSDIWGWYSDDGGGAVPSACGRGSVIEAGNGYTYSCNGGIQQNGWQHSWGNTEDIPEQWNNAPGNYTATATVGSSCLANVQYPSDWWIGESIYTTSSNVLPGGTTVTGVGSCSGSNSLTLSQAVLSGYGESQPAGLSFTIDISPDYAIGVNGGQPGTSFGICSGSLLALGTGTSSYCLQWLWHANNGGSVSLGYAGKASYFNFGQAGQEQAYLSVSSPFSADGRVPFLYDGGANNKTTGYFLFQKPLYLGSSVLQENAASALGVDPFANGEWPTGSGGYGNEYCNAGDTILNDSVASGYSQDGVFGWQCVRGGKDVSLTSTLTAGSASVTATDANYTFAPGDTLSGTGIAPNTWVTAVTSGGYTMNNDATASGSNSITAERYGKIHASSDTITVTNGSANATLSGSDWSQYDTINCADCAAGTYIASINGSSVVLSRNATGSATVSAGGVDGQGNASLAAIPETPGGGCSANTVLAGPSSGSATPLACRALVDADLPSGVPTAYPGAGVPNSTGSAWGTSYTVGTGDNDLVQLNGSAQLPAVSGVNLTALPSITLAETPLTTLGDLLYVNSTPALARLAGNTTSTVELLTQTGNGTVSAAPAWETLATLNAVTNDGTGLTTTAGIPVCTQGSANTVETCPGPALLTSAATFATTSFTSSGLTLSVPASETHYGECEVQWQMSSTSYTATLGLGVNETPTAIYASTEMFTANTSAEASLDTAKITNTTSTAVSNALTAGAANTTYQGVVRFVVVNGSTASTLTLYGEVSNSSGTLSLEPGSVCKWVN